MNSTPTPKETEPHDAPSASADERLAHAHEQIKRADEQLTRLTEQLAKMERDDAHPPSAGLGQQGLDQQGLDQQGSGQQGLGSHGPGPQPPPGRPALRVLIGLTLASCTIIAALVLQSSYGGEAKLVVARWAPQLVSTPPLPPENLPSPAQPSPSAAEVAAAEPAPPPPQATTLAQAAAPQDAAPTAPAAPPDNTQWLQTMVRDLANVERSIEQLRANQQQMASDNSKAIEELKASQEEIKRVLARVSEQSPPRTSPPPAQPAPTLRKPERTPPQARARPRYPREWMYDDW